MVQTWDIINATQHSDLFAIANVSSEGKFGLMLVLSMYIVSYMIISTKWESVDALLTTASFMMVISILLCIAGAVYSYVIGVSAIIMIIALAINIIGGRR